MNMKRIILVSLLLLCAATALSQQLTAESPFVLNVDYARFKYDEENTYLEIYYAFYPSLVTYQYSDGKYRGGVNLGTQLRKKESGEVVMNRRSFLPMAVVDSSDSFLRSTLVTQAGFAIPFGEYELEVVANDSVTPSRIDKLVLPVTLKPTAATLGMSDLELCSNITNSENKSDPFFKNTLIVVPNPTLVFGVLNHPVVFSYAELYNVDQAVEYAIKTTLRDPAGTSVRESSRKRRYSGKNAIDVGTMNVASIPSGKYTLEVSVLGDQLNELSRSGKTLYINNPHIRPGPVAAAAIKASELAGLSADELAEEFRTAQYVATSQEIKMFSQITSEDGRREFLAKFWVDVESGADGRTPISRNEYVRRVSVAKGRYRAFTREGWKTDRGRAYILYGEPDNIERFPSSESSKPHELWSYYQIENGVEFVFIDRSGFGDYIQVHSTKRGELYDDQWQRFLY